MGALNRFEPARKRPISRWARDTLFARGANFSGPTARPYGWGRASEQFGVLFYGLIMWYPPFACSADRGTNE